MRNPTTIDPRGPCRRRVRSLAVAGLAAGLALQTPAAAVTDDGDEDDQVWLCQLERYEKWKDWEYAAYFRLCSTPEEEGGHPFERICRWRPIGLRPEDVPRHLDLDSILEADQTWGERTGNRVEVEIGCNTVSAAIGGGWFARSLYAVRQWRYRRRSYEQAPRPMALLEVFYGTSRVPKRDSEGVVRSYRDVLPATPDEEGFGEPSRLRVGKAVVSIPPGHVPGELESPSIWSFALDPDPGEHVVVREIREIESTEALVGELRDRVGSANGAALVFVHGYNVTFREGVRRTAQLYCDLGACEAERGYDPPAPILFSWPAGGGVGDYAAAEEGARASHEVLEEFLALVRDTTGAKTIHLIAHSMGNRVLAQALGRLAGRGGETAAFNQIVLAAPDITRTELANVADEIAAMGSRVTLYASSEDLALRTSSAVHGVGDRAGYFTKGSSPFVPRSREGRPLFDAIDATDVKMGELLGHSYVFRASLLPDLTVLFQNGSGPDGRCRSRWYDRKPDHWVLRRPTRRQLTRCIDDPG